MINHQGFRRLEQFYHQLDTTDILCMCVCVPVHNALTVSPPKFGCYQSGSIKRQDI